MDRLAKSMAARRVRHVAAAAAGMAVLSYVVLVALNASVGHRECRAVNIHEIVYDDPDSIELLSPCAVAYAIRGA